MCLPNAEALLRIPERNWRQNFSPKDPSLPPSSSSSSSILVSDSSSGTSPPTTDPTLWMYRLASSSWKSYSTSSDSSAHSRSLSGKYDLGNRTTCQRSCSTHGMQMWLGMVCSPASRWGDGIKTTDACTLAVASALKRRDGRCNAGTPPARRNGR